MKKIISFITDFFDIPLSFTEEQRRQKLLDILLALSGFAMTIILVITIVFIIAKTAKEPNVIFDWITFLICIIGLFVINRSRIGYLARILFVGTLFVYALLDTPNQIANGRALLYFSVSIIAAGILIRPSASFVLAIASSIAVEVAAYYVIPRPRPIPAITVYFLLATMSWMAAQSMEKHIKHLKKTYATLKDSEERYRALVEISPDMVVLTDLYGGIIVVNRAGLTLFGFTDQEQVKGRKIFDFIAESDRQRAITEFSRMAEFRSAVRVEYTAQTQQGTNFYIEISASVIRDSDGNPQAVLSVGRDVTLRKKMELSLMAQKDESQEAYQALINNSAQGLVLLQKGRIILANKAIADSLGLTLDEIYALSENKIFDFVHPEDREIGFQRMQDRLSGKAVPAQYETRIMQKNGTVRWMELRPTVLSFNGINTTQITTIDITERKQAENALRISESKYRRLHESLRDGFAYVNMEGRILECNETFQHMLGYSFEELTKLTYFDLTPEIWHEHERKIVEEQILPRGYSDIYEKEYRRKDGRTFPVELRTFLIQNEAGINEGMWATIRDITERKRAEEALRQSEERYRNLAEAAHDIIVIVSPNGQIEYVNKFAAHLFDKTPEEITGLPHSQFFPPNTNERHQANLQKVFEQGQPVFTESQTLLPKGEIWLSNWLVPLKDEAGITKNVLAISRDISEYKRMETALRESEERYRSLAEAAQDMIFMLDPDDRIQYVNQFAAQVVNMTPEKAIGLPRSQLFPSSASDRQYGNIRKVFEKGQPTYAENFTPFPTGDRWLSTWLVPLKDESGGIKALLGISRDISERKVLEQSLTEAKNFLEQRVAERTADLIKSHEQLRQLTHETVLTQEKERKRLSRELHDEAGQGLVSLAFSIGEILNEIPDESENVREKIIKILERVDKLNQRIRGMAHGLRPPILDVAGIDLALRGFCRDFSAETHFPIIYTGSDDLPALSDEINITLYRIVQESITNAVKHGHVTEVHVSLSHDSECITLAVRDNGAGFDTANAARGAGLIGIEERLGLLGGRLEIASRRKHGTRLKAIIPLPREITAP